jgi:hypothetical protein
VGFKVISRASKKRRQWLKLLFIPPQKGAAKQVAERVQMRPSAAKAATERKALIAALEVLRHPKPDFSAALKAMPSQDYF